MNTSQLYILLSLIVLVLVALLVFTVSKNKNGKENKSLSAGWPGFCFPPGRFIGYGLIGTGVILLK